MKFDFFRQLTKFGIIGISASTVNFVMVVFLVEAFSLHPLSANVFAFLTAFSISYFGHRHWTFNLKKIKHSTALTRFFSVSLLSFFANEGLFYLLLKFGKLYYPIALLLVLLTIPMMTFLLSKYWAFKYEEPQG